MRFIETLLLYVGWRSVHWCDVQVSAGCPRVGCLTHYYLEMKHYVIMFLQLLSKEQKKSTKAFFVTVPSRRFDLITK